MNFYWLGHLNVNNVNQQMKNKLQMIPKIVITKKPPRQKVTEEEFRQRLSNIEQWREQKLAELLAKNKS